VLYGAVVKKTLIVFAVALGLPFGLLLISYFWHLIQTSISYRSTAPDQAFSFLYSVISLFGTFALFSYLGKVLGVKAVKPIILSLFLGFLIGNLLSSLFIPLYSGSSVVTYLGDFVLIHTETAFWEFFPALAALLLVELRTKKLNTSSTA
jgi:hypothetical protein